MPPSFWVALGVLIGNDHLLKGSGWLPAGLTGKLSDLAGLIVAPLLLCRLLRARTRVARVLAFAAVTVPFVAVKVSETMAAAAGAWMSGLGMPTRVWCDPTDLIALPVLLWSWQLAEPRPTGTRAWPRSWLERAGIAVAAIACMATSFIEPEAVDVRPPFIINWTRLPAELEIRLRTDLPCPSTLDAATVDVAATLPLSRTLTLEPGQVASIVADDTDRASATGAACGAARISTDGGASVLVSWSASVATQTGPAQITQSGPDGGTWYLAPENDWAFERAVTLVGAGSDVQLRVGDQLERAGEP